MHSSRRTRLALAAAALAVAATLFGTSNPALASLTNPSLVMSNNAVGSSATYTAIFSTGTAAVTDLVLALPSGVSGLNSANATVSTASSCTGTFSTASVTPAVSGNTIGFLVSALSIGTCVKVVITGLTNQSSTGTSYACAADGTALAIQLTSTNLADLACGSGGLTNNGLTGALFSVLVGDQTAIALTYVAEVTNAVTTDLNVAPVLNAALNNTYQSFNITPTSSGVEASNANQALTVDTNAQTYTVEGLVSNATSALTWLGPTAHSIPFGYTESTGSSPASCSGSGTAFGSNGTYSSLQSGITGLTDSQTTNINYCWNVDLTSPAGEYQAVVTYLVVPSF